MRRRHKLIISHVIATLMLNCRGTVLAADVRPRDETDAIVGARGAMSSRIIGGVIPDSPLSKYAHVVAIFVQSGMSEYFRCGGTLISNVHVMSAAHCPQIYPHIDLQVDHNSSSRVKPHLACYA